MAGAATYGYAAFAAYCSFLTKTFDASGTEVLGALATAGVVATMVLLGALAATGAVAAASLVATI